MSESRARPTGGLPKQATGVTTGRQQAGVLLTLFALPLLTAALVAGRGDLALGSVLLLYLLAVVVISVVGGIVAGLLAAVSSSLLANFFLTPPYHTFVVADRDSVLTLVVFLLVASMVSVLVDVAARRQGAAVRSEAEAALIGRVAGAPLGDRSAHDVLSEVAATFGLVSVALVERRGGADTVLAQVGPAIDHASVSIPAGPDRLLLGEGPPLFAEDRRLLAQLSRAAARALDAAQLAGEAERARELAQVDRLRTALLAAVGHDLRTPVASLRAAASTLASAEVELSDTDRDSLLGTVVESADRLADLIANLLDLSRLQAGALSVDLQSVPLDEVVARALIDRHLSEVVNAVPDDLPMICTDVGLLERVVANLADNAWRHSPSGAPVRIDAHAEGSRVVLRVVDHGSGVAEADWEGMFVPFQRLDDRSPQPGVGLGLAIVRGFTDAIGGTVRPTHTPGGGLTMTVALPRAVR